MMTLDALLPGVNVALGVLNALLLLRVLHILARRVPVAAGLEEQRRSAFRHAYAAHLLSQMRPQRTPTPAADAASPTVIELGDAMSWRRRAR